MHELPLFPLNSVLFPGTAINLHIFEKRYQQMINQCLETEQPFGVVLISEGQEAYGVAKPHMIGCTAHITRMQPLGDGRMDITAVGRDRFEIRSLQHDRPYLVGLVELQPIIERDQAELEQAAQVLRPWVTQYLRTLARIGNVQITPHNLPADPVRFAYLAAAIVQNVPQLEKQTLLDTNQALELLHRTYALYKFEVQLLQMMLERSENDEDDADPFLRAFSVN
jgi:Lon protease-like protein